MSSQEHSQLLKALRESELLRELSELLGSSLDLTHILQVLVRRTAEACEVERCAVWLLDESQACLRPSAYHLSTQSLQDKFAQAMECMWHHNSVPLDDPIIVRLLHNNGLLFLEDTSAEPSIQAIAERLSACSILLIALVREDQPVGIMLLDNPSKTTIFTREQQRLACAIGQQAVAAINNARLYQQAQIEKAHILDEARQAVALATERANTLDAVFNAMTEGLLVIDMQGQVILNNNTASHFVSLSPNMVQHLATYLKHNPAYTFYGQPIQAEDFPLMRALQGERIRGERFISKRKDGSEYAIEVNIASLLDSQDKQIGIVSAFRDITEQVRAEQRIRRALDTMLHAAEEISGISDIREILYRVLAMTMAVLNCERGVVQLYNQTTQIFQPLHSIGFSLEEADQWLAEQKCWPSPEKYQDASFHTQLLEGHATMIHVRPNRDQTQMSPYLMVLAAPIMHNNRLLGVMLLDRTARTKKEVERYEQGATHSLPTFGFSAWDMAVVEGIGQFAGLAIEQTRWKQEAEIARTNEASMRESNELKDEFLAITAHEFRTPLTVILTSSQMTSRQLQKATSIAPALKLKLDESLSSIEEQTHHLTNIVNTFLEVTRLNRGQIALAEEEIQLEEVLKETIAQHSATLTNHAIHYHIEPSKYPYVLKGDKARLLQIFANLLQNAIKYSPFGGPITVSMSQCTNSEGKGTIKVSIEDKGIGVPKDAQPYLFERFYRAPNIGGSQVRGVGLGLYLVAEFLSLHGGSIHVESNGIVGEGSRFIFTLPLLERELVSDEVTPERVR